MYYISSENFSKFLVSLKKDYEVFVPVKKGQQRFYQKFTAAGADYLVGEVRAFEPLKSFFFRARERVASGFSQKIPQRLERPFAIVGVKACDLKGFKIQDYVFSNHDYQDPFYLKLREANLVISADCTSVIESCFCTALGLKPYPQMNFDLNLSSVDEGYLVEIGSSKGKRIVEKYTLFFRQPREDLMSTRNRRREKIFREVEVQVKSNGLSNQESFKGVVEKGFESEIWSEEAEACVECGACNTICPTCHCFLLYDQQNDAQMERLRIWDSCMIKDFARVAGGANPREKLWMRLRNRFEKKFDFFPKVAAEFACTGCGRCISACPAKIDIRKVLKKLVDNAKSR
ncbi:MAG: 4Fe-4S dicluster domain-containing protein [Candidatus Omnitrophica bacterium]|nr:4Fe-4S dicluster domain-containing protein [Candidatus Omnitrophota bacterium]MBU2044543.1 4Fe-4S dicluster domain-containing protein [Candidatus Omnitrophota bacterium]MBU2250916.1 4Fe-4S dicluster domain-containing protein [Candidatus Omnitrophota bacterium]MBU2265417.1 4Fe-4S dicluster domain-containing protein [Candidatus Omnitrophota bacterium]MBU2473605.1 4Fe-4S dicluster domain-containing protein [Candidatus Omnitrophota bacterium]